jgi:hypothetical protein
MIRQRRNLPALSPALTRVWAICCAAGPVLLAAVLAIQTTAIPPAAIAALWPPSQRESESETPAPEATSKATNPYAIVSSTSARARRAQADRLMRLEHEQARATLAQRVHRFRPARAAEQEARNGRGCALRC